LSKLGNINRSRFTVQSFLLAFLACVTIVLGIYVEQSQEEGGYPIYYVAIFWLLLLFFFLWFGNLLLFKIVQRKFLKGLSDEKRFGLQLFLTLLFSLLYINLSYWIFKTRYTSLPPNDDQLVLLNIYGILFLIPVLSVQFGFLFLQKWKQANLEREHLKREQIHTELISLKSHISPHFMFNNLNILSSLISEKNELAQDFLDKFAEVYRYVLRKKDSELVVLKEELEFIRSFVFLLQERFHEELKVDIKVAKKYKDFLIPPLALQMLIENALKHNKMTEETPLLIKVFTDKEPSIIVKNTLALRNVPDYEKTGTGLDNIKRRYELISKKRITIHNDEDTYTVILPLIKPN